VSTKALNRETMLALERMELLARLDGHHGALEAEEELGFVSRHIGGAWALSWARDTTTSFNRVMGLGLDRPASPEDLTALKAFYAEQQIPSFRIALCPAIEPADFETTLQAAGFGLSTLVKWVRDGSPAEAPLAAAH
jgi:hypothetical protein